MNARPACVDPRVEIASEPSERWHEELTRLCAWLVTLPDRDAAVRVRVSALGPNLLVRASLPDGRVASRVVRDPDSLADTLEALLSVPIVSKAPADDKPASQMKPVVDPDTPEKTYGPQGGEGIDGRRALGVEAGGTFGLRASAPGGRTSFSAGGFAQLRVRPWLLGMGIRGDLLATQGDDTPPGFEMDTVAISLSLARRVQLSGASLDVGLSPRVVLDNQGAQLASGEFNDSTTDARLAMFGRLGFGQDDVRLIIDADVELSPGHLRRDVRIHPELPLLPTWTAGLGIGVSWAGR